MPYEVTFVSPTPHVFKVNKVSSSLFFFKAFSSVDSLSSLEEGGGCIIKILIILGVFAIIMVSL